MTTCPLCQHQVDDRAACHGCGLTTHCTMIKCPNCQYEFVQESRVVSFFKKIGIKLNSCLSSRAKRGDLTNQISTGDGHATAREPSLAMTPLTKEGKHEI
ncbi:MAG: hypothetical protein IPJ69_01170 [Deltaproteobacteria bacterium]|nr:MAG: hypothetical protein IPJ69_01170 [Deltaproteobacteria bacterium]